MKTVLTRRAFVTNALTGVAVSCAGMRSFSAQTAAVRVAFLSDLHLDGVNSLAHQNRMTREAVSGILGLSPRPAHVVVLGDISCRAGAPEDYALAKEILSPLEHAGIKLDVAMGNHDRREALSAAFPRCGQSPVPGRIVRTVDLGVAELVLLDSHDDGKVDGAIDEPQETWLSEYLQLEGKPVFICVHHDGRQMKRFAAKAITCSRRIVGYIHGHRHEWIVDALHGWSGKAGPRFVRSVGLPSSGYWGDIGFAVMDFQADSACLTLRETDCFFPDPTARTAASRQMCSENDGARVAFLYDDANGVSPLVTRTSGCKKLAEGPLKLVFTGTGGADWKGFQDDPPASRAFASLLLDEDVLIDWHRSARRNLPQGASPSAIVYTHSHADHFSPESALELGSIRSVYISRSWINEAKRRFAEAVKLVGGELPEIVAVDMYEPFVVGGLTFRALPANHRTEISNEECVVYQVQKRGTPGASGVNLLYATDTGGLMKATVDAIDGTLNALVMNAMVGPGHRDNPRIFAHFTAEQVLESAEALRKIGKYLPPDGRPVWTTHLSRELNDMRQDLAGTYPCGLVAAHDGLCLELK